MEQRDAIGPRLPAKPVVAWHAERATMLTWAVGAFSLWFGSGEPPTQNGTVALSENGLTIGDDRGASRPGSTRFISWDDVETIDPIGTAAAVADIRLRSGEVVQLGRAHLPRRRAAEVSIERASLLGRALVQARQQGSPPPSP